MSYRITDNMDSVEGILAGVIPETDSILESSDYIGDDGLVYCGKCHTKKQSIVNIKSELFGIGNGDMKVPCKCKCQLEADKKSKEREEYEEQMIRLQRIKDASLMDAGYRNAKFSTYKVNEQNKKVFNLARNYCNNFEKMLADNQGLLLYGPVGTGKSYTAACIANELLNKCTSVIMTSFVKILQNIEQKSEADYISMLNSASLLILDDLGTERNTDYALEKVYNIIDSRSRASMPMILTTNLSLNEMLEASDIRYKRIYDRILETCFPVEVPGESFRRMSAAMRYDIMSKYME